MRIVFGEYMKNLKNINRRNNPKKKILFCGILLGLLFSVAANAQQLRISGVTESVHDITMSVADEGIVKKIFHSVGEKVEKNQPIIELNNTREELEMKRRKLIWESKVELLSAAKRVDTLGDVVDSSRALYKSTKSISKEELDLQQLEYDMAVSELDQLEIGEKRERLEFEIAQENFQRRFLKSPINGIIVKLVSDVGEHVDPEKPFVQIVDHRKCYIICQLEESLGRNIKKGTKADIEVMAGAQWISKKATVVFVSPVVDQASGLLEVKLEFSNSDGLIRPGVPGVLLIDTSQ